MFALRIIVAVLCFFPIAPLFAIGMRSWVANCWGLVLLVLAVAQLFYPTFTKWLLLWLLIAIPLTFLLPDNNPTSLH